MRPAHRALAAVLATTAAAAVLGLAAQPDKTPPVRNPDLWPDKARPGDFAVPPGIYTSILIANPTGSTATVTLKFPSGEATIVAPEKDTVVIPLGQGWQVGQQGIGSSTQSNVIVTGITTSGPVRFTQEKK